MRFSKMCACTNTRFTTLMFLLLQVVMTTTKPASRSSVAFFKKCDLRVDAFFLNVSHNNIYICSYSCCYCLEPLIFLVLLLKMYHMLMNSWFLLPNAHKGLGLCPIVTHSYSWLKWPIMTSNHAWWLYTAESNDPGHLQSPTKPIVKFFGSHLFKGTKWIVEEQESSVERDGVDLTRANEPNENPQWPSGGFWDTFIQTYKMDCREISRGRRSRSQESQPRTAWSRRTLHQKSGDQMLQSGENSNCYKN